MPATFVPAPRFSRTAPGTVRPCGAGIGVLSTQKTPRRRVTPGGNCFSAALPGARREWRMSNKSTSDRLDVGDQRQCRGVPPSTTDFRGLNHHESGGLSRPSHESRQNVGGDDAVGSRFAPSWAGRTPGPSATKLTARLVTSEGIVGSEAINRPFSTGRPRRVPRWGILNGRP